MAEFSTISSHSSFEEENQDPQAIQQQQANNQQSAPASGNIMISSPQPPLSSSSSAAPRKRPGRPLGTKNKPKAAPICITQPATKLMQLIVPMGYDISNFLQNYARKNRVGVRVLNGTGNITHFSLIHPPTDTITEEYTLVRMSGTYVDTSLYSNSTEGGISSFLPRGHHPWLTVLVTDNFARLYGGTVYSSVFAATNVVLDVQTFKSGGFYFLDIGQPDGGPHSGAPGGGGSDVGGGFAAATAAA